MNYLLYLVYGGENYNNEALYSLLSYYKLHTVNENNIVMYTDDSDFFKQRLPENVTYVDLTAEQLKEWKGEVNFNHRIKVKALQEACTRFQGNILYVDTDTNFIKNISGLFSKVGDGAILFHKSEGRLIDNPGGIARKMRKFLKEHNTFMLPSLPQPVIINETLAVWNAGAIGFNAKFFDTLVPVEQLTDAFYSRYKLFVMEQVAFNYFFQKISPPVATDDHIHHYWYFKEFRTVLKDFFAHHKDRPFMDLVPEIGKIDPEYLSAEKRAYKVMSFWQKQFIKLTKGRKWKILDYKL